MGPWGRDDETRGDRKDDDNRMMDVLMTLKTSSRVEILMYSAQRVTRARSSIS